MPNPWILLAVVLVWVASLTGVGYWQNDAGHVAERVVWQDRQVKEANDAATAIKAAEDAARAKENAWEVAVAQIAQNHEKELQDEKNQHDNDMAAAYSGSLGLRFSRSTPVLADSGAASGVAAGAGIGNGAETVELPRQVAASLFALVDDADGVADQLRACQQVVRADRSQ